MAATRASVAERLGLSRASVPLAAYAFVGLSLVDVSRLTDLLRLRTLSSFCGSLVLLLWCSKETTDDEIEDKSWQWSTAASRGVWTAVILSSSASLPVGLQQLTGKTWTAQDGITLVASFAFTFMIALAVYLMLLLNPAHRHRGELLSDGAIEALKLEHQACLTLFEAVCTGAMVLFVTILLAPLLGETKPFGELTSAKLAWAFYWMAGPIIWLLRPCLARAKYIRNQLETTPTRQQTTTQ